MRKFTLFLVAMVTMVTTAFAQTVVSNLADFKSDKCYTVTTTERGGWTVSNDKFCSTNDAGFGTSSNPEDANQQFAVLTLDNVDYYLYSVGAKKFVNSDGSLIAGRGEAIEFADASKMGEGRVRVNFKGIADTYINIGGSNQMTIDLWSDVDAGNAVQFLEVGDFDPTEALAMLNNIATITYQFQYEGNVFATQEVIAVPGEAYPDYTLSAPYGVSGSAKPEGTVNGDETVVIELTVNKALPFEAVAEGEPTKWYYAQIHGNHLSYMTNPGIGTEMPWKVNGELITAVDEANADNYTWGFVGDLWTGFKMVSKAGGAIKSTGSGNVTIVENLDEATSFIAIAPQTENNAQAENGFCLFNAEAGQYMNAQNIGINHWNANDAGSTIIVTEREITVEPEPETPFEVVAVTPSEAVAELSTITVEFSEEIAGTQDVMAMETIYIGSRSNACNFTVEGKVLTITLWTPITTPGEYALKVPASVGITRVSNGEAVVINGEITFTVEEPAVEPEEPDTTEKQYRVKCDNGYLNIYSTYAYPTGPIGGVNIAEYAEDNNQIFTVEDAGDGNVYLKSASGLYIYCQPWNVDGNANDKSALTFEETENGKFYIKCSNGYFKVQNVSGVPVAKIDEVYVEQPALSGYFPYCDAAIDAAALWSLEEVDAVEPEVPETPTGLNETVVFDFVNGAWGIPTMEENNYSNIKTAGEYTDGTNTINIDPTANSGSYIYDNKGFLQISKPGTKITLPAFGFAVEKIEVVGHSSGTSYPNVDMNVYVGKYAVSTPCIGSTATSTFEIAAENQAAGNVYELVIGSNGGNYSSVMCITYIKVYPAENKLEAPAISLNSGVYIGSQIVNVYSATADLEGVTNVTYYYTTDGNEPTVEDEETDGEITIENSCTLKVIVELTYGDKTYVSASTSAEYIISEAVTYHRAVAVESGSYFLAANGNVAAPLANNVLPAVETTINGNDLTEAAYYAITLEEAAEAGTFYIKDANGNYIYTSSMYGTSGPKLSSNGAYTPMSSWTITIADDENSTATIVSEGLTLVFDTVAGVFKVTESVSDDMVLPTFYGTQPTGVENVITNGEAIESIYDLQGRKIEKVTNGGIYIINGKKVLVK